MGQDNVVTRAVFVTATGRGDTSETKFEDHVGDYV
jgi:hypothetical protein